MIGRQKIGRQWVIATFCIAVVLAFGTRDAAAVTVNVIPSDGLGEGFNDAGLPEANAIAAGNAAATLGAQRLASFQAAANVWGAALNSATDVTVNAAMDPLGDCISPTFVVGSTGPQSAFQNFTDGIPNTVYPVALANKLSNMDQQIGVADIGATFDSQLDSSLNCAGSRWFYALDNRAAPAGLVNFFTAVLHELGHGLCFASFINGADGSFAGNIDIYSTFLESHLDANTFGNLSNAQRLAAITGDPNWHWLGPNVLANLAGAGLTGGVSNGHPQMFAPNPFQMGSSVSHWHEDFVTAANVHEFMEPIGDPIATDLLSRFLCQDIGWGALNNPVPVELQIFSIE